MKRFELFFILFFLAIPFIGLGQSYNLPKGKTSQKIHFQLINNLIVVPVSVNGAKLSFILDSGVSKPILFNISDQDSIQINNVREITINGLGSGEAIKALSSRGNTFELNKVVNVNQDLYVVMDKELNFSPTLGIPIHGIIGYDLFKDFVVDINYDAKIIKFHVPEFYKKKIKKKSQRLPIHIKNRKAYLDGIVVLKEQKRIPVRLLIDTGSSDAIWLFEDESKGLAIPDKNYDDFLGKGLNGEIFGKRTVVDNIEIGSFSLKEAKTAFPNMITFSAIKNLGNRNGSLGGEVLRRFNIIFNYPEEEIIIKRNNFFNKPFHYNMSGVALQHGGLRYISERISDHNGFIKNDENSFGNVQLLMENKTRLSLVPEIIVTGIRAGSPAALAGLKEGDLILAVNGKKVYNVKLQEVLEMMNEKAGKRIRVLIERYNRDVQLTFRLKKPFK